ncbi:hypothetical protein VR010_07580 [Actinomycetaceae bacterium L2_0104]
MSSFMDWVLDVAASHPDLEGAFVNADGQWLDVLLADGRAFRFRPGEMIDETKPEETRRKLLDRLISIGVAQADEAVSEGENGTANGPQPEGPNPPDGPSSAGPRSTERTPHRPSSDTKETPLTSRSPFGSVFDAIMGALPGATSAAARNNTGFPTLPPDGDIEDDEAVARPDGPIRTLPIVRPADYFLASHDHSQNDSMVYVPLTDFIGVGLADDFPDTIEPIFFSDLEERGLSQDLGPLFVEAVEELRSLNLEQGTPGLELGIANVAGAQVFLLTSPHNYQSSWFADLDMTQTITESLTKEYPDSLPLFVPASRTSMFVVMADDPNLADVFKSLRGHDQDVEALYPLPHTVASDGWSEWIPMSDHPAATILSELRTTYRERMYDNQITHFEKEPEQHGAFKAYDVHHLRSGAYVSNTQWTSQDSFGSIPETDFITFNRQSSGLPWDEDRGEMVSVRSHVAREVWADGFQKLDGVWPPRWQITGFPAPEQLDELREASHRDF